MVIRFTKLYANNGNFGINFQAEVDGQSVTCVVSQEALQDIDPSRRMDTVEQQYKDNQSQLELIARRKIENGEVVDSKIFIYNSDLP